MAVYFRVISYFEGNILISKNSSANNGQQSKCCQLLSLLTVIPRISLLGANLFFGFSHGSSFEEAAYSSGSLKSFLVVGHISVETCPPIYDFFDATHTSNRILQDRQIFVN